MNKAMLLQLWLLEQLAVFRFLCPSQFIMLEVGVCGKTLAKNLNALRERKMCDKTAYRFSQLYGRKEDVRHLLPKGRDYLIKFSDISMDQIKMPIGKVKQIEEYTHRKMTISAHITIKKALTKRWIGLQLFDYDFEKKKKTNWRWYEGATKITVWSSFLKSDAIFIAEQKWATKLFCLEIHNQYRVGRIIKQMKPYAFALAEGSPSLKFGIDKSPRILIVFEEESTLLTSLELASNDTFYLYMRDYFLFKTYNDLLHNTLNNWINLKKEYCNPFFTSSSNEHEKYTTWTSEW